MNIPRRSEFIRYRYRLAVLLDKAGPGLFPECLQGVFERRPCVVVRSALAGHLTRDFQAVLDRVRQVQRINVTVPPARRWRGRLWLAGRCASWRWLYLSLPRRSRPGSKHLRQNFQVAKFFLVLRLLRAAQPCLALNVLPLDVQPLLLVALLIGHSESLQDLLVYIFLGQKWDVEIRVRQGLPPSSWLCRWRSFSNRSPYVLVVLAYSRSYFFEIGVQHLHFVAFNFFPCRPGLCFDCCGPHQRQTVIFANAVHGQIENIGSTGVRIFLEQPRYLAATLVVVRF